MSMQPMSDQGVAKSGQQESSTGHSVQRNGAKFTRVSRPRNNAAKHEARSSGGNSEAKAKSTRDTKSHNKEPRRCQFCDQDHLVSNCAQFKSKSVEFRKQFVCKAGLCFCCLWKHYVKDCKWKKPCTETGCDRLHHPLLHQEQEVHIGSLVSTSKPTQSVLLKVIPVRLYSKDKQSLTTFAMLDSGSTVTMIAKSIASRLGITGLPEVLSVNTVLAKGQSKEVKIAECFLSPTSEEEPLIPVSRAHVVDELHIDESRYGECPDTQPYAVKTPLSWCVAGPTCKTGDQPVPSCNLLVASTDVLGGNGDRTSELASESLELEVKKRWEKERHGFACDGIKRMSVEDKRAMQILESKTAFIDGNYQIGLLWREENPCLPNNKASAEKRLRVLQKRFAKDSEYAAMYRKAIEDYITKGYAVQLSDEEAAVTTSKTWYLPHHGVQNPNKPGRVKVVFDAAARYGETSLNQELLQGPDLTNSLVGVLTHFRLGKIAVTADVEAMFMQFKVPKEDCQALRFLWWSDEADATPQTFCMTQHIFGATDSPSSCTYGLRRCSNDNAEDFDKSTVDAVNKNFYVDDLLKSVDYTAPAICLAMQLIEMLGQGGLRWRNSFQTPW
ncbi:uncharacterized protein LOC135484045 [Lineus longissimus]|uniref:uncharacterized protein LOC135484045 n=1 Tax=Lineus longissimus TaxID=88925 RepID=UPI00315D911C